MLERKISCLEKKPSKDTQCADCVNSSLLVDALIVAKIRGIKRRNTENVLNSFCPLGEKDKSPSAQNDQGISRRLEWGEKDTGKSKFITDHNCDCIFRNCKKCGAWSCTVANEIHPVSKCHVFAPIPFLLAGYAI